MTRTLAIFGFVAISFCHSYAAEKDAPNTGDLPAPSDAAPQWVLPAVRVQHVQERTFESAAAKTKVSYFIYTPDIYKVEKERRFPVSYWLHGTGGGSSGVRPLVTYFDAAIVAGKIPPMLIVFANGLATSMWCDAKDGSVPMETIVVKELVPEIDARFRTIASREGRLIEGFSMGGYGAGRVGFKYHDLFGAVSMLGAGPLHPEFHGPKVTANPNIRERLLQSVYGGDIDYFKAQSPWVLAEQNADALRDKTRVRQIVGTRDFTLGLNRDFDAHLTRLKIPHTLAVPAGVGHDVLGDFEALGEENWKFYLSVFSPTTDRLK